MEFGLGYVGELFYLELLSSTDPDMQGACFLFNWFFSLTMTFALIALLVAVILRPLTRS
ncbi:MAG: hypothetical protein QXX12_03330 [Nanopusillaceae archaeon]